MHRLLRYNLLSSLCNSTRHPRGWTEFSWKIVSLAHRRRRALCARNFCICVNPFLCRTVNRDVFFFILFAIARCLVFSSCTMHVFPWNYVYVYMFSTTHSIKIQFILGLQWGAQWAGATSTTAFQLNLVASRSLVVVISVINWVNAIMNEYNETFVHSLTVTHTRERKMALIVNNERQDERWCVIVT